MATIYVTEPYAVVRKTSQRIVIEKEREVLLEVPAFKVDRLLLLGNIQVTGEAISFLLENGIQTSFFSQYGRLKGKLSPLTGKNVFLRIAQFEAYNDENFGLSLAKDIVRGKIKNAVSFIHRFQRNHPEIDFKEDVKRLKNCLLILERKQSVGSVVGIEGVATAIYFKCFSRLLRKKLSFEKRVRRPPGDPVNALLSLGYVLLTNELFSLLDGIGFDPYIGFLHGINYGRPSLALDLAEEFRHFVVDRLTLRLINREVLKEEDFEERGGGYYLKDKPRKTYFEHYEKFLLHPFSYEEKSVNFRYIFFRQAQKFAASVQKREIYHPFRGE